MAGWYRGAGSIRLWPACVRKAEREDSPTEPFASLADQRILIDRDRTTGRLRYADGHGGLGRADAFYNTQRRLPLLGKVDRRRIVPSIRALTFDLVRRFQAKLPAVSFNRLSIAE